MNEIQKMMLSENEVELYTLIHGSEITLAYLE
jgi:hypothetical protein